MMLNALVGAVLIAEEDFPQELAAQDVDLLIGRAVHDEQYGSLGISKRLCKVRPMMCG